MADKSKTRRAHEFDVGNLDGARCVYGRFRPTLTALEAHHMTKWGREHRDTIWEPWRVYRSRHHRGGLEAEPGSWVYSWDTAKHRYHSLILQLGRVRIAIGLLRQDRVLVRGREAVKR